jgi:hypothetical protein
MFKTSLPIVAALLVTPATYAQQAATPQQAPAQPQAAPCNQTQPKPPKWLHSQAPPWLQQKLNKVQSKTGEGIDPNQAAKEATKPAPCPVPKPAPKPIPDPSQKPPAAPVPATAPAKEQAPILICPPKSVLVPGQKFCVFPDHRTVDAIPLPAGTLPEQPKPAPPNQHN